MTGGVAIHRLLAVGGQGEDGGRHRAVIVRIAVHADGFPVLHAGFVVAAYLFEEGQQGRKVGRLGGLQEFAGAAQADGLEIVQVAVGKNVQARLQRLSDRLIVVCHPHQIGAVHGQQIEGVIALRRLRREGFHRFGRGPALQGLQAHHAP